MSGASDNKRLAKNTVLLYVRSVITMLITLYTSRVTLQVLGVEDFGIYNVIGGVVAIFSTVGTTLATASQRFLTYALGKNDIQRLKQVFSTCITLHFIIGFVIVLLLETVGLWFLNNKLNIPADRMQVAGWVLQFSIITVFIGIISVPYNALIIAHEKMSVFAYIGIIECLFKLGSVFLILAFRFDRLILFSLFHLVISIIIRLIYSSYSNRKFEESHGFKFQIEKTIFKDMFSFVGWNLFGNIALVLKKQGVDIVLNTFYGVLVNAAKGVSNQVDSGVYKLSGNVTAAMKPQLTKAVAIDDRVRINSLINMGTKYSFYLMLFLTIPIVISAPQILDIWLVKVPEYSVTFVRWSMVYLLLVSLSWLLNQAVLSEGRIKAYQIVMGITNLFAIPVVYLCISFGAGPISGIWACIIIEFVILAENIAFTYKLLKFDYKHFICNILFKCIFLLFITFLGSFAFHKYITSNVIIDVLFSMFFVAVSVLLMGMTKHEKNVLLGYIKNYTEKKKKAF